MDTDALLKQITRDLAQRHAARRRQTQALRGQTLTQGMVARLKPRIGRRIDRMLGSPNQSLNQQAKMVIQLPFLPKVAALEWVVLQSHTAQPDLLLVAPMDGLFDFIGFCDHAIEEALPHPMVTRSWSVLWLPRRALGPPEWIMDPPDVETIRCMALTAQTRTPSEMDPSPAMSPSLRAMEDTEAYRNLVLFYSIVFGVINMYLIVGEPPPTP